MVSSRRITGKNGNVHLLAFEDDERCRTVCGRVYLKSKSGAGGYTWTALDRDRHLHVICPKCKEAT